MNFKDWMIFRGLSASTAEKYAGAISGPLSAWAMEGQLVSGSLNAFTTAADFQAIAQKIRGLATFRLRNERGHNMYGSALTKFTEYLSEGYANDVDSDINAIMDDPQLTQTERLDLVKSRIGQGTFRQKLLMYWQACAVTGYQDATLLVASHIKPWRSCTSAERLNPFNGLLLSPNLDKAFDAGLVTFAQSGPIALSPLLTDPGRLGITSNMRVELHPQHEPFMCFHRSQVFRPH